MNKNKRIKYMSRFLELVVRNGLRDNFPLCCIAHFSIEELLGLNPAQERIKEFGNKLEEALNYVNDTKTGKIGFIPCHKCVHKFIREANKLKKEVENG